MYIYTHTECPGRNTPNFGRMFLRLNYIDRTKNTYNQNRTVMDIMVKESKRITAVTHSLITKSLLKLGRVSCLYNVNTFVNI